MKIPKQSKTNSKLTQKEKPMSKISIKSSRYLLKCIGCGKEYPRTKKSKTVKSPEKYRCRCGSRLSRVR